MARVLCSLRYSGTRTFRYAEFIRLNDPIQ